MYKSLKIIGFSSLYKTQMYTAPDGVAHLKGGLSASKMAYLHSWQGGALSARNLSHAKGWGLNIDQSMGSRLFKFSLKGDHLEREREREKQMNTLSPFITQP